MQLKCDKIEGILEELYHEERNRDYAVTGGGKQRAGRRVIRSDPMDVSNNGQIS